MAESGAIDRLEEMDTWFLANKIELLLRRIRIIRVELKAIILF